MQRLRRVAELVKRPFFNKQAYVLFEKRATPDEKKDHEEYKHLIEALEAEARTLPVGTKVAYLTGPKNNEFRLGTIAEPPEPGKFTCKVQPLNGNYLTPITAGIQWMEEVTD